MRLDCGLTVNRACTSSPHASSVNRSRWTAGSTRTCAPPSGNLERMAGERHARRQCARADRQHVAGAQRAPAERSHAAGEVRRAAAERRRHVESAARPPASCACR